MIKDKTTSIQYSTTYQAQKKKKRCCTYCEVKQGSSPQSSQTVYVRLYATAEGTKENILFKEESNK